MIIFQCKLDCGHRLEYALPAPKQDDIVWCVKCNQYVTVAHVNKASTQQTEHATKG